MAQKNLILSPLAKMSPKHLCYVPNHLGNLPQFQDKPKFYSKSTLKFLCLYICNTLMQLTG